MLTLEQKKILTSKKEILTKNIEALCYAMSLEYNKPDSEERTQTLEKLESILNLLIEYEDLLKSLDPFLNIAQKMLLQSDPKDEFRFHESSEFTEISVEMSHQNHQRFKENLYNRLEAEKLQQVLGAEVPGSQRTTTLFALDSLTIDNWINLLKDTSLVSSDQELDPIDSNTGELK